MMRTYKAAQVREPGKLNLVELPIREPGPGQVRLRVEACGVCHSDAATVEGQFPSLTLPRVPGHEVVGRIDAVGLDVSNWKIGQRVGVGFFGGQDGQCQPCQRGDFVNCAHPVVTGITTFNALRNASLRAGDLVAIQGVGGLGHLGIQFARRMGFKTVALNRGKEKEKLAKDLGAHVYIDTSADDAAAVLQRMGGAAAILATAPKGDAIAALMGGLAVRGKLIVVAVPDDLMPINALPIVFGERSILGSLTGKAIDNQETLDFSVLQNVRPMIETVPLERAAEAYAKMMAGKARFRMVLTMTAGASSSPKGITRAEARP